MNEILTSSHISESQQLADPWNRKHFESPALQNVDKLSTTRPQDIMSVSNLAAVAISAKLNEVVRWKPRNVSETNHICSPLYPRCAVPRFTMLTRSKPSIAR